MPKQLNVRSDEAYERAHRAAARRGITTTEAVVRALRRYEADEEKVPRYEDLTPQQKADYDHFRELARRAREEMKNGPKFDDDDMYDEFGLPK